MNRTSKHILKYQTGSKTNWLDKLFDDYRLEVEAYIDLILQGKIPLQALYTANKIQKVSFDLTLWQVMACSHASSLIMKSKKNAERNRTRIYKRLYAKCKSLKIHQKFLDKHFHELRLNPILESKWFKRPKLKNITIFFNKLISNIHEDSKHFDMFVKVVLPYRDPKYKNRGIALKLPVQNYSYAKKKFKSWKRKDTVTIRKDERGRYFLNFFYEKDAPEIRKTGKEIGFDQGYHKLFSDSEGNHYGRGLENIYKKLANKKRGSKKYKGLLIHKKQEINRVVNSLPLEDVQHVVIESLKYVKHNSKINRRISSQTMNKMQYWSYRQATGKLENICEENGILLTKVIASYTSQTCSRCGIVDGDNRSGEHYHCSHCGLDIDADYNAAINILRRGKIDPTDRVTNLGSEKEIIEDF